MSLERLDKIVAQALCVSRKDARKIILAGKVAVGGITVRDISAATDTGSRIAADGRALTYSRFVYYMMNKPAGVLSVSDDRTRETVVKIIERQTGRTGLFPVGRLDRDTTGLLIITDDGDFCHRVISPKKNIEKEYIAAVDKLLTDSDVSALEAGVTLADKSVCRPAKISFPSSRRDEVAITVTEGKYHEIKRMLGVVGAGVNSLERIRIGGLVLDSGMSPGDFRLLDEKELSIILK